MQRVSRNEVRVISILISILGSMIARRIWIQHQEARKKLSVQQKVLVLDELILSVNGGSSLRQSLHRLGQSKSAWKKNFSEELLANLDLQGFSGRDAFVSEILRLAERPYRLTLELRLLRNLHFILLRFEKRQRQLLLQSRIQAIFLLFMLGGVLIFEHRTQKFAEFVTFWLVGLPLFALGTLIQLHQGRRHRWKT